jgi:hypothetical protein
LVRDNTGAASVLGAPVSKRTPSISESSSESSSLSENSGAATGARMVVVMQEPANKQGPPFLGTIGA